MDKVRYAGDLNQDDSDNIGQAFPDHEPEGEQDIPDEDNLVIPQPTEVSHAQKVNKPTSSSTKMQSKTIAKTDHPVVHKYNLRRRELG